MIEEIELDKLLDMSDVTREAIKETEMNGIVFIDEIDKICSASDSRGRGADASAEGALRNSIMVNARMPGAPDS